MFISTLIRLRALKRPAVANCIDHFPKKNEILSVVVNALDRDGQGVVFVKFPDERRMESVELKIPEALPGERFDLRVSAVRGRQGKLQLKPVLEIFNRDPVFVRPGPGMKRPVSSDLLEADRKSPSRSLIEQDRELVDGRVHPLAHCHYRTQRVWKLRNFRLDLGRTWRHLPQSIEPATGIRGSERVVEISDNFGRTSPLWTRTVRAVVKSIGNLLQEQGVAIYDERSKSGLLRKVVVKHGDGSAVLVHFILGNVDSGNTCCMAEIGKRLLSDQSRIVQAVYVSECRADHKEISTPARLVAGNTQHVVRSIDADTRLLIGGSHTPAHAAHGNLINFISDQLKDAGPTVWDIAAGPGSVSAKLRAQGKTVLALEGVQTRLEDLRANGRESGFRVLDADLNQEEHMNALIAATQRHKALQQVLLEIPSAAAPAASPGSRDLQSVSLKPASLEAASFYHKIERWKMQELSLPSEDVREFLLAEGREDLLPASIIAESLLPADADEAGIRPSGSASDGRRVSQELAEAVLAAPDAVVVSFPVEARDAWRKGLLSKQARRFIRTLGTRKLVLVCGDGRALKRDLGHFGVLGYQVDEIKVFDTAPHSMKFQAVAVLSLVAS